MEILLVGLLIGLIVFIIDATDTYKSKLMKQNYEKRLLLRDVEIAVEELLNVENLDDPLRISVHKNSIREILVPVLNQIKEIEDLTPDDTIYI